MAGKGKEVSNAKDKPVSYKDDPRTPCKYGSNCYQKNEAHQKRFKHAPKRTLEGKGRIRKGGRTCCAVPQCSSWGYKEPGISYHRFPKKEKLRGMWVSCCNQLDGINVNKARLCSKHFLPSDYKRDLQHELLGLPTRKILSPNAVPSQFIANYLWGAITCSRFKRRKRQEKDDNQNKKKPKTDIADNQSQEDKGGKKQGENKIQTGNKKSVSDKNTSEVEVKEEIDIKEEEIGSLSSEEEEEADVDYELPPSPEDVRESIKQKFLVDMPEDFYSFWEYCESLNKAKPAEALKDLDLYLVGPFDVLSGALKNVKNRKLSAYLRHWRYYYDPPEFQTVIRGGVDSKGFHMGYFRDDPKESPVFVASSSFATGCKLTPLAENLFGAVYDYINTRIKTVDPFLKMRVQKVQGSIISWTKKKKFTLDVVTPNMEERSKKIVTNTFHGIGIVVPYDRKTEVGYRELSESDRVLKQILKRIVESESDEEKRKTFERLQYVITNAYIANDECDFGTGLELGLDLFLFGGEVFHQIAQNLLTTAYGFLKRDEFAKIIKAHAEHRKEGTKLSMLHSKV